MREAAPNFMLPVWAMRGGTSWFRDMASLLRQYGRASKDYQSSMQKLQKANPDIPAGSLRKAVADRAREQHSSKVIDLRDNGFSFQEVSVGDILGFADPSAGRMEGEVGDVVLWTTHSGEVRGEVIGDGIIDGPPLIATTRVRVTSAPAHAAGRRETGGAPNGAR